MRTKSRSISRIFLYYVKCPECFCFKFIFFGVWLVSGHGIVQFVFFLRFTWMGRYLFLVTIALPHHRFEYLTHSNLLFLLFLPIVHPFRMIKCNILIFLLSHKKKTSPKKEQIHQEAQSIAAETWRVIRLQLLVLS